MMNGTMTCDSVRLERKTKRKNKNMGKAERYYIEKALKKRVSVSQIAEEIGYSRGAVYYEIRKGSFEKLDSATLLPKKEYAYDVGQRVYEERMKGRNKPRKLTPEDSFLKELKYWIVKKKYSPQAALYKLTDVKLCVSSVYNYIHAEYIPGMNTMSLPYAKPKTKKKRAEAKEGKTMPKGTSIEQRPKEILNRDVYGHWEMDTVYSSKDDLAALLVLTERKTREEIILKLPDRTMKSVNRAIDRIERRIGTPAFRRTFLSITCDNGSEFSDWEYIENSCRTRSRRTKVYFCHPYCSGERGSNENENRMIRRWIPKGDDIGLYSDKDILDIQDWINSYPREMFGGRSAMEMVQAEGISCSRTYPPVSK